MNMIIWGEYIINSFQSQGRCDKVAPPKMQRSVNTIVINIFTGIWTTTKTVIIATIDHYNNINNATHNNSNTHNPPKKQKPQQQHRNIHVLQLQNLVCC